MTKDQATKKLKKTQVEVSKGGKITALAGIFGGASYLLRDVLQVLEGQTAIVPNLETGLGVLAVMFGVILGSRWIR